MNPFFWIRPFGSDGIESDWPAHLTPCLCLSEISCRIIAIDVPKGDMKDLSLYIQHVKEIYKERNRPRIVFFGKINSCETRIGISTEDYLLCLLGDIFGLWER